jgi:signal transduction histidine kinase
MDASREPVIPLPPVGRRFPLWVKGLPLAAVLLVIAGLVAVRVTTERAVYLAAEARIPAVQDSPGPGKDLVTNRADDDGRRLPDATPQWVAGARRDTVARTDADPGRFVWAVVVLGIVGVAAGLLALLRSIGADLDRIRARAAGITQGDATVLALDRRDELGALAEAVDRLGTGLAERARQAEFGRRQFYYQDKMSALGTMATGFAHEIGNPLAAITGVAEEILEAKVEHGCRHQGARCHPELIIRQTARMASMTRRIADFAAPRGGGNQWIDLNEIVRGACSFLRYDRRYREIELAVTLGDGMPAVFGVPDHLVQVLMNLLVNAADAFAEVRGQTGRVDVSTRCAGDMVILSVRDNGRGMDDAVRARIFEPFFTTKPASIGTGLGLPLCRRLVEEMHGRIEVTSRPGVGTEVTVCLKAHAMEHA